MGVIRVLFGSVLGRFEIVVVMVRLVEVELHRGLVRSPSIAKTILVDVADERSPGIIG